MTDLTRVRESARASKQRAAAAHHRAEIALLQSADLMGDLGLCKQAEEARVRAQAAAERRLHVEQRLANEPSP